ncbi:MAG: hypothetical protein JSW26_22145 [Desulfobacterales bacterium]|nr:MAG: hypothetical protein JSW26_22145 [Desulfobacterales bacterium]
MLKPLMKPERNSEPQNIEGWFRFAQSFYKIDRIPSFDIRPARNALNLGRGKLDNLIHSSMFRLTQRQCAWQAGIHYSIFDIRFFIFARPKFLFPIKLAALKSACQAIHHLSP